MKNIKYLGLLALAACGLSQEKFEEDIVVITCDKYFECMPEMGELMGWADSAACQTSMNEAMADAEECVNYDAAAAQGCLDGWSGSTCDDMSSGTFTVSDCENVCEASEETTEETSDEGADAAE